MTNAHTAKRRRQVRVDFAPVRADAERRTRASKMTATPTRVSPEGWRFYTGTAAFGDIVQAYPDLDPPRVEFRPWDEVKAPESVASLRGVPLTGASLLSPVGHPIVGLVTADDVKPHLEGAVLDAWVDEASKSLRFEVVVYTASLAEAIDNGTVEVSLAYDPEEDATPGVFEGQRYDVVQRNIKYNAASVVDRARAERPTGEVARLDRAPADLPAASSTSPAPESAAMKLTAAALALLEQMPEADKALIMRALEVAAGEMAEATMEAEAQAGAGEGADLGVGAPPVDVVVDAVAPGAGGEGNSNDAPDGAGSDAKMDETKVKQMIADAMGPVMDALKTMKPPAAPAAGGGRSDAAPHLDADAVIAQAKAEGASAGAAAGHAAHEAAAALVKRVRLDGHPDVHTAKDAAARMLAVVKSHTPLLGDLAEAALKDATKPGGRMDGFVALYAQAAALKAADDQRLEGDMRHVVLGGVDADTSAVRGASHNGRLDHASTNSFTYVPSRPLD